MTQAGNESGDQRQPDEQPYPRGYWVSVVTMLLILTYTGIQIWQTCLVRQNDIVSQRAFVYTGAPLAMTTIDPKDKTTKTLGILFYIVNSGNTPTKNLNIFTRCAPSAEDLPEPWVLLYRETPTWTPGVIGPHATVTSLCGFNHTQMMQISEKTMYGYLLGDISYQDRLDSSSAHRTQFSLKIIDLLLDANGNVTGLHSDNVGRHNCADEECPQN
jgi:hypothetical protein